MNFKSEDFSKMLFPVFDLKLDVDLLTWFPSLSVHQTFSKTEHGLDHNLVLRYVFFCYDKSNKKLLEINDLTRRKETAIKLAGFKEVNEQIQEMMLNKIPSVNDMIIAFCRIQNNRLFQMKLSALEAFYEYQRIIIEPIDMGMDDDKMLRAANLKTKLIEDCDLIHEKINKYNQKLYGSIEDAEDFDDAVVRISPENISKLDM